MTHKNGLKTLINETHISITVHPVFGLDHFGNGPDEWFVTIEEEAKQLGINHLITTTGVLPYDVVRLVPSAGIVVIPSFVGGYPCAALSFVIARCACGGL